MMHGARCIATCIVFLVTCRASFAGKTFIIARAPHPMSSDAVIAPLERVHLSEAQRHAILYRFDAYEREMSARIEAYAPHNVSDVDARPRSFPLDWPRRHYAESLRRYESMWRDVTTIEASFFDDLAAMLTADQQAVLQRHRLLRAAQRHQQSYDRYTMNITRTSVAHLRRYIDDSDWTADEVARANAVLDPYDAAVARHANEIRCTVASLQIGIYDDVRAHDVRAADFHEPARRPKAYRVYGAALDDHEQAVRQALHDLATLHRHTFERLETALYPRDLTASRTAYIRRTHQNLLPEPADGEDAIAEARASIKELLASSRQPGGSTDDGLVTTMQQALRAIEMMYLQRRRQLDYECLTRCDERLVTTDSRTALNRDILRLAHDRHDLEAATVQRVDDLAARVVTAGMDVIDE